MKYTMQQFSDLIMEVEAQGGEHLEDLCTSKTYELTGSKHKPVTLAGCNEVSLFEIPYEGLDGSTEAVTVCAIEDNIGMWPRYRDEVLG